MTFFVKFWGTRGSIPTPGPRTQKYGGNTSCVEIRVGDALFICDGGSGIRELGVDLMRRGKKPLAGHLLFSHAHWDHIQGFPFFVPAYVPGNSFLVWGNQPGDTRFHSLLSGQMQSDYFPVNFSDLRASILPRGMDNGQAVMDGVQVRTLPAQHPGGCLSYSFEWQGHRVVYSTDNELDQTLPNRDASLKDTAAVRRVAAEYVEFFRGADLLIADGQYTDAEYVTKVGWGHPRATTVVDAAIQAGVKQLALFHHDPMHSDHDVEAKVAQCRERAAAQGARSLVVFAAREGVELRLA